MKITRKGKKILTVADMQIGSKFITETAARVPTGSGNPWVDYPAGSLFVVAEDRHKGERKYVCLSNNECTHCLPPGIPVRPVEVEVTYEELA